MDAIIKKKGAGRRRRQLLLGGAAAMLHAYGGAAVRGPKSPAADGAGMLASAAAETIQPGRVNLAEYGGVPGASGAAIIDAFHRAFEELKAAGGGVLLVPPGTYDFGRCAVPGRLVSIDDLNDVTISAYGATFRLNTSANVIPCMFYFANPNRVIMAGAGFNDTGYDADVNWRGMYCVKAESDRLCSGFKMVDCHVNGAVGMFQSLQHGANRYLMKDISLHGTVKNAYYGAGLTYVGDNAKVDLVCDNVRRGCISFGLKNASIQIRMRHSAGAPGSNGFISLACEGASEGNVENVRVNLDVSGVARHKGLIHFYHVKTEPAGSMRNITAHVTVNDLKQDNVTTNVFVFDHELPSSAILASTARGWDRIFLSGRVSGSVSGHIIHNPSVSTSPGTISVDPKLAAQIDMAKLPDYFHVKSA